MAAFFRGFEDVFGVIFSFDWFDGDEVVASIGRNGVDSWNRYGRVVEFLDAVEIALLIAFIPVEWRDLSDGQVEVWNRHLVS